MQSQDSALAELPLELLVNIAKSLPTKDFNNLRLACKPLEDKIFPYWANSFFKMKQFMITPFSLKTLVDISQHKSLSKVMTNLVIGLDDLSTVNEGMFRSLEEYQQWSSANCAQQALLQTSGAIDLLSTALLSLPNLKAIQLRDFDSPTRYRDAYPDGRPCKWRSYGYSANQEWRHAQLGPRGTLHDRIFQAVMTALDRYSPELEALEVMLRAPSVDLSDKAFACTHVLGAGLTRVLNNLTKLHLDVDGRPSSGHQTSRLLPTTEDKSSDVVDPATTNLRDFLALTTNVTWLRLNFHKLRPIDPPLQITRFLRWLSLEPDCTLRPNQMGWSDMNPAPVALPLRRLDLGNIVIELDNFRKLLSKFSSLEELCLKGAILYVDDDVVFYHDRLEDIPDCAWAKFIRDLPVSSPNLHQLTLSDLNEKHKSWAERVVFFDTKERFMWTKPITTSLDPAKLEQLADITWPLSRYNKWQQRQDQIERKSTGENSREDDGDVDDDESVGDSGGDSEDDEPNDDLYY